MHFFNKLFAACVSDTVLAVGSQRCVKAVYSQGSQSARETDIRSRLGCANAEIGQEGTRLSGMSVGMFEEVSCL